MTRIRHDKDSYTGLEFAVQRKQLVVEKLPIVQAPRLIQAIVFFVPRAIGHLATMTCVGEKEDIPGLLKQLRTAKANNGYKPAHYLSLATSEPGVIEGFIEILEGLRVGPGLAGISM